MTDDRKLRLLELYEARGDPETLIGYGDLLECHGRYALRQAVAQYERDQARPRHR